MQDTTRGVCVRSSTTLVFAVSRAWTYRISDGDAVSAPPQSPSDLREDGAGIVTGYFPPELQLYEVFEPLVVAASLSLI